MGEKAFALGSAGVMDILCFTSLPSMMETMPGFGIILGVLSLFANYIALEGPISSAISKEIPGFDPDNKIPPGFFGLIGKKKTYPYTTTTPEGREIEGTVTIGRGRVTVQTKEILNPLEIWDDAVRKVRVVYPIKTKIEEFSEIRAINHRKSLIVSGKRRGTDEALNDIEDARAELNWMEAKIGYNEEAIKAQRAQLTRLKNSYYSNF